MFQKLCLGIVAMMLLCLSKAQAQSDEAFGCGFNQTFCLSMSIDSPGHGATEAIVLPPSFPAAAIDTCGKFRIFYEDVRLFLAGYGGAGFADSFGVGATRRNTMCAVLSDYQNKFDFSNIPSGEYIRIYVDTSRSALFPVYYPRPLYTFSPVVQSAASPFYKPSSPGDTVSGFVHDYIKDGVDPMPGDYHGFVWINFYEGNTAMPTYFFGFDPAFYSPKPLSFNNGLGMPNNCEFDLYSILMHATGHLLGWFSWRDRNVHGVPDTITPYYTNYELGTYYGPKLQTVKDMFATGVLTPSVSSVFPFDGSVWINNRRTPHNMPLDGGITHTYTEDFHRGANRSPGDYSLPVMKYGAFAGELSRVLSKIEIETFHNNIGYDYNPTFETDSAVFLANSVPWSYKMSYDYYSIYDSERFLEEVPADFTITNNTGVSITINLLGDTSLHDDDGDTISVYTGSLVNFRGCGSGGNNHNQISISSDGRQITYTPRANFYGKAQFGFNLWDGKEKGAFVVYTIEVLKGNAVSVSAGGNMVQNGDFEEGSEVRIKDVSDNINNSAYHIYWYSYGRFYYGTHLADGHYFPNGTAIKNSYVECTEGLNSKFPYGSVAQSFPYPNGPVIYDTLGNTVFYPNPVDSIGNRYETTRKPSMYFLNDTMEQCKRYILEFDLYRTVRDTTFAFSYPSGQEVNVGFTTNDFLDLPEMAHLVQSYKPYNTKPFAPRIWKHISIPFTYCSDTPSTVLYLSLPNSTPLYQDKQTFSSLLLDNLSLKLYDSLTVAIMDSSIGHCQRRLYHCLPDMGCPLTFEWRTYGSYSLVSTDSFLDISTKLSDTFILVVSDGCGRTASDTFNYELCACSVGAVFGAKGDSVLPSTLSTGLSAGIYHIASDLTISSSLSFVGANILVEPDVKITVAPTAVFTLDSSHLFVCPDTNKLWKGIRLASGANIEVLNNSFIEDADTAIFADAPSLATGSSNIIKTYNSIFNRNRCAIAINNFTASSPSVYPFEFSKTVFTSRYLDTFSGYPNAWATSAALAATYTNTLATAPYVLCRDYLPLHLKNNYEPLVGIKLSNVGTLSGSSYPYIRIGTLTQPSDANLFDNVGDGINAQNSNFSVRNTAFANSYAVPKGSRTIGLPYAVGTGIYADKGYHRRVDISYDTAVNFDLYVQFYDCAAAIKLSDYSISKIYRNNFYMSNADPKAKIRGIDLSQTRYDSCIVTANFLYNIPTGIYLYSGTGSSGYSLGKTQINNNSLQPELPSPVVATGTESMLQGIEVSAALYSGTGTVTDKIEVKSNVLNRVYNGIKISNYSMQRVMTIANTISMSYQSAAATQYGAYAANNYNALIYGNSISGIGSVATSERKRAFYNASNRLNTVDCNNASHTGRGFDFDNIQPQTYWRGNTMLDHKNGMALGGPIDQQGKVNYAILDKWNGAWGGTDYQTLCYNRTNPALSILYLRDSSLELPTHNIDAPPYIKYDLSSLIITPLAIDNPCSPYTPPVIAGVPIASPMLIKIKKGIIDYGDNNGINAWIGQMSLWKMIQSDDSFHYYTNNDFVAFAAMADTARFGWLTAIEAALGDGDTSTAQTLLNNPVAAKGNIFVDSTLMLNDTNAADDIVSNYVQFYELYLGYLLTGDADSSSLADLAYRCPRLHGEVVYQVRAFYAQLYSINEVYNDDSLCAEYDTQRRGLNPIVAENENGIQDYTLYPNPNNGTFTLASLRGTKQSESISVKVYNALGQQIYQNNGSFVNGKMIVNIGQQAAGMYLVCIGDSQAKTTCLRFTVK